MGARRLLARRLSTAPVTHSLKRRQTIAFARPTDNAGAVTASVDSSFDLGDTIFKTLPKGSALEKVQISKLNTILDWAPAAVEQVNAAYTAMPPSPAVDDEALHRFMRDECDFAMEHADGSFIEHLHFCRDYTTRHFAGGRPRVMLMHSICGVGTNCFPMRADQLPRLESLLTPAEFAQVQAFPTVLRLLVHGPLLAELPKLLASAKQDARSVDTDGKHNAHAFRGLRCHRLLDNAPIHLTAEQLIENLNYQLIHLLDFLPAAAWKRTSNDFFFQVFVALHEALDAAGELRCEVGWDAAWMQPDVTGARPPTVRHWIIDMLPQTLVMRLASQQVKAYSAAIGHSLDYELADVEDSFL